MNIVRVFLIILCTALLISGLVSNILVRKYIKNNGTAPKKERILLKLIPVSFFVACMGCMTLFTFIP